MSEKTKEQSLCPYVVIGTLQCAMSYRLDEFYRQMSATFNRGTKNRTSFLGTQMNCQSDPQQCPRYLEFQKELKQKQR